MKKNAFILFAIILIAGCKNSGGGWSAEDRQKGLKMCMDEVEGKIDDATGKKYCGCVLEKAMQKYPSYAEADKGSDEEGTEMAQACAKEFLKNNADDNQDKDKNMFDNGLGGWSNADQKKYMSDCVQSAINTGADEQTSNTYCDCTLKKLMKKYKSYSAANSMTQEELSAIQQECAPRQQFNDQ